MKHTVVFLLCIALLPTVAILTSFMQDTRNQVRHVVVFKYKPNATEAQIQEVTTAFRALKANIPGIVSFETGINNSPENKNQGFTHVYLVTFKNTQARDAYLPHPEHKKFGELLGRLGVLEDAFVVDYVPEK